jgi:hypothetical protein
MKDLIGPIQNSKLKPTLIPAINGVFLINLFDNDHYSQNDFDVIDSKTRDFIKKRYLQEGWQNKGARHFYKKDQLVSFAKPSHTLGSNPNTKILEEINRGSQAIFCTPTQTLLVLAELHGDNQSFWTTFSLMGFLEHTPANLQTFFQWLEHDNLGEFFIHSRASLKEANDMILKSKII